MSGANTLLIEQKFLGNVLPVLKNYFPIHQRSHD